MLFVVHALPCTSKSTKIKKYNPNPTDLLLIGVKPEIFWEAKSPQKIPSQIMLA